MPAGVCVWAAQARSWRAMCTAEWIVKPAAFTAWPLSSVMLPSMSTRTRLEAVICSKRRPNGFSRNWLSSPGMRAEKWVKVRSVMPCLAARR